MVVPSGAWWVARVGDVISMGFDDVPWLFIATRPRQSPEGQMIAEHQKGARHPTCDMSTIDTTCPLSTSKHYTDI